MELHRIPSPAGQHGEDRPSRGRCFLKDGVEIGECIGGQDTWNRGAVRLDPVSLPATRP